MRLLNRPVPRFDAAKLPPEEALRLAALRAAVSEANKARAASPGARGLRRAARFAEREYHRAVERLAALHPQAIERSA